MTTSQQTPERSSDAFAERILTEINAGMSCLNLYLGDRLGLFQALADSPSATPAEMATRTGCAERYVREWLKCMAVGGYIDHQEGRFSLPPEHVPVLLDKDSPAYVLAVVGHIPAFSGILSPLMDAFRTGGGVPYEAYGRDAREAIGLGNRPMFINDYVSSWIPMMPDVQERLRSGGRVAEVGCGQGWSSVAIAQGFPSVHVDSVDLDAASIDEARANATEAGVGDRVSFHLSAVEDAPLQGPYDLVTAFECLHDMAYPVDALKRMRELAGPGGTVLIADELVGDTVEENSNFLGHMFYNFSVLHCLPQAMVFPDAAGTGTVMGPATLRRYADEAGFSGVEILPIDNPMFRFYKLTP